MNRRNRNVDKIETAKQRIGKVKETDKQRERGGEKGKRR